MGSVSTDSDDLELADIVEVEQSDTSQPDWQCGKVGLLDRTRFLLEDADTLCDVVAVVGKGVIQQEVPCHRFILAIGSPVFQTLFYGPTRQVADGADLRIPDVEPAAFRNLLRYFYVDDVSGIDDDNVIATLFAAKRYEIAYLRDACLDFMRSSIRPENVFVVLEQARQNGEVELVHRCLDLIDQRTFSVINTAGFLDIDIDTLAMVLCRDELSVREIELFNALERWSLEECERQGVPNDAASRRRIADELIKHIRFPLMSVEELANGPVQSGVLSPDEVTELFLYLFAIVKPEIRFRTNSRQGPCGEEYVVTRFTEIGGSWGYAGGADSIQFSVNRDIVLLGCGLYGSNEGPAEHSLELKVRCVFEGIHVIYQDSCVLKSDGTPTIFRTLFKEPISVRAGVSYIVSANLKGTATFSGKSGSSKVSSVIAGNAHPECIFTFSDSPESGNGSTTAVGQLPSLIFCLQ